MDAYKGDFIAFAIDSGALRFGEFVLKSGRVSPYFFNTGVFDTGASLARLAGYYATAIRASGIEFDVLFGPAYKGIPLVASVAVALAEHHDLDVPYAFSRKEAKDHGEGGMLVGAALSGGVLIVDDVISAGTAVRESVGLIEGAGARCAGIAISLDRQERGTGERSAIQEVESRLGVPVLSVVTLDDLVAYLDSRPDMREPLARVAAYREAYGAAPA